MATTLIQTVRALDTTGPGPAGEHLTTLFRALAASPRTPFHAVEESALRWLLKTMSPAKATPTAELVQRFPTTWRILACIFERVPLFSLAKALADRRFVAVLRQTLERLQTSSKENTQSTQKEGTLGKRKRGGAPEFKAGELDSVDGVLATADAVFDALRKLVGRVRSGRTEGGHARMGAEHVKSLFCLPVGDAITIMGPLLGLCRQHLLSGRDGEERERENEVVRWVDTACALWGLHLQGQGDAVEVATHVVRLACGVVRELEGVTTTYAAGWKAGLERFLRANVVLPSRGEFLLHKTAEVLTVAMDVAAGQADVVGTVVYGVAVDVYRDIGAPTAGDDDWIKTVFRTVEEGVREMKSTPKKTATVLRMMQAAAGLKSAVATEDLQGVCARYGLEEGTDWGILKEAAELDQTLFFVGEGEELLERVCDRMVGVTEGDAVDVALAIVRGFCTARNLQAFIKRWHGELARARAMEESVWFSARLREGGSPLVAELEGKLSPQQVVSIIQYLDENSNKDSIKDMTKDGKNGKGSKRDSKKDTNDTKGQQSKATIVVAATLASGLSSEQFVDAVGMRLYDLVKPHLTSKEGTVASLGWRVVARTAGWLTATEAGGIWTAQKKALSKILKKMDVEGVGEAFGAACALWKALYPDGEEGVEGVRDVVVAFLARYVDYKKGKSIDKEGESDGYVERVLYGPERVIEMLPHAFGEFPDIIKQQSVADDILKNQALVDDASFMRALVNQLLTQLSTHTLTLLQRVPVETYTRDQRRSLMASLVAMAKSPPPEQTADFWPLVFGLMVRLMRDRPTFYDGIEFADMLDIADVVEDGASAVYAQFATIMVQQTAAFLEDKRGEYFAHAARFVEEAFTTDEDATHYMRLRLLDALLTIPETATAKLPSTVRDGLDDAKIIAAIGRGFILYITPATSKKARKQEGVNMSALQVAMDAAASVRGRFTRDFIDVFPVKKLEAFADKLLAGDSDKNPSDTTAFGWRLKSFLVANFSKLLQDTRPAKFGHHDTPTGRAWRTHVGECVSAVVSSLPRDDQFEYVRDLVRGLDSAASGDGKCRQLFALGRALGMLVDLPDGGDRFAFAAVHAELAARLRDAALSSLEPSSLESGSSSLESSTTELDKLLGLVHILLDKKSGFMTQWSVESTLAAICVICTSRKHTSAPLLFPQMCAVVETLIKRHRVRLEGHYHIITTTLQCLLGVLMSGKDAAQAGAFARLITLLCVPTAGSIGRYHKATALDSATATAKRFAGQYMYIVLTTYIRLLLDKGEGREVRDALEPAWNAVFDVMPAETRRVLNDGMDEAGRDVVREMWRRYTLFGKWSGV